MGLRQKQVRNAGRQTSSVIWSVSFSQWYSRWTNQQANVFFSSFLFSLPLVEAEAGPTRCWLLFSVVVAAATAAPEVAICRWSLFPLAAQLWCSLMNNNRKVASAKINYVHLFSCLMWSVALERTWVVSIRNWWVFFLYFSSRLWYERFFALLLLSKYTGGAFFYSSCL